MKPKKKTRTTTKHKYGPSYDSVVEMRKYVSNSFELVSMSFCCTWLVEYTSTQVRASECFNYAIKCNNFPNNLIVATNSNMELMANSNAVHNMPCILRYPEQLRNKVLLERRKKTYLKEFKKFLFKENTICAVFCFEP